jgi:protein phosphatase
MMNQAFEMPLDVVVNNERSTQNAHQLEIAYGGCSLQGRREENQDALIVKHPSSLTERDHKGSIACIADGVSCSDYGQQASHTSVMQFVSDYYATPNSWSVKHSAHKVLTALNSWLFNSSEKTGLSHNGLVTTFSTVIFKSNTAHLFHVGDSRIYLYRKGKLRQLTRDHQRKSLGQQHFLTRALGMDDKLDIDYQTLPIKHDDLFLLTTDGVHEYLPEQTITDELSRFSGKFEQATKTICHQAMAHNSKDNISALLVQVTNLPHPSAFEFQKALQSKAIPPALSEGNRIDHYVVKKSHTCRGKKSRLPSRRYGHSTRFNSQGPFT